MCSGLPEPFFPEESTANTGYNWINSKTLKSLLSLQTSWLSYFGHLKSYIVDWVQCTKTPIFQRLLLPWQLATSTCTCTCRLSRSRCRLSPVLHDGTHNEFQTPVIIISNKEAPVSLVAVTFHSDCSLGWSFALTWKFLQTYNFKILSRSKEGQQWTKLQSSINKISQQLNGGSFGWFAVLLPTNPLLLF